MSPLFGSELHAGLSGIDLEGVTYELGEGVQLSDAYAHLMAPFIMAFAPPPGGIGPHPGPWKAATGGFGFDVSAELTVPADLEEKYGSKVAVARTILFLLRLYVNPAITLPVFSTHRFAELPKTDDKDARLVPYEVQPRHFPLGAVGDHATPESIQWVREHWQTTHRLYASSAGFELAVEALSTGQFVENTALTLVSLWAALEGLFSPSTSELRFRVSALIAAYLEDPGKERASLQKAIAKLYDKRSAAAHGKPKHGSNDLLDTFILMRRVLVSIINSGEVPTPSELESVLFGDVAN
jgi:hypothetical protein